MLESPKSLKAKVDEAVAVLQEHQNKGTSECCCHASSCGDHLRAAIGTANKPYISAHPLNCTMTLLSIVKVKPWANQVQWPTKYNVDRFASTCV